MNQKNPSYDIIVGVMRSTRYMKQALYHQMPLEEDAAMRDELRNLRAALIKLEQEFILPAFERADDLVAQSPAVKTHLQ
jgi:hypothetical protein